MNVKALNLAELILILLFGATAAQGQLAVTVSPPKVTGNKAVVSLELKNTFKEKVESARAVCFLLDEQGKIVGQATQWVIGGTKDKPPLAADAKTTFNLIIPMDKVTNTNLTAKVSLNRIILEGGKVGDPQKDFELIK